MKICSRCKQSLAEASFARNKTRLDGLNHRCRDCTKEKNALNYLKNKERILKANEAYRQAHREEENARIRRRYARNPEAGRTKAKEWRNANPHKSADQVQAWKRRNLSKVFDYLLLEYKKRAEKFSLCWVLSDKTFEELVLFGSCYYCGSDPDTDKNGLLRLGIDRLDNTLGYTIENSVSCCATCNKMKNVYTVDKFLTQIDKINMFQKNRNIP